MRKLNMIQFFAPMLQNSIDSVAGNEPSNTIRTIHFYGDPTKSHSDNVKRKFKNKQSRHSRQINRR